MCIQLLRPMIFVCVLIYILVIMGMYEHMCVGMCEDQRSTSDVILPDLSTLFIFDKVCH